MRLSGLSTIACSCGALAAAVLCAWLAQHALDYGWAWSAWFGFWGLAVAWYWTGVAWLLARQVCLPWEAAEEFNIKRWLVFMVLAPLPCFAAILLLKLPL